MDITGGALNLAGHITNMASYGNVTAYDGAGSFVYNYNPMIDRTIITAVIPEPATMLLLSIGALVLRRKR